MTVADFFSPILPLSAAAPARDLDADAESESAARRAILRGCDSDRVSSSSTPKSDKGRALKPFEDGRLKSVYTSIAAIVRDKLRLSSSWTAMSSPSAPRAVRLGVKYPELSRY